MADDPYYHGGHKDSSPGTLRTAADNDELRDLSGIDPEQEQAMEDAAITDDMAEREGLKGLDDGGDAKGTNKKGQDSQDGDEPEDGGWKNNVGKDDDGGRRSRFIGRINKKRAAIVTGIGGVTLAGGFLGFVTLHGPAQLVQLASVLSKFSATSDHASSVRTTGFFRTTRYYKTGFVGETRVGYLGSRRFHTAMTNLESQGITFRPETKSGRPTRMRIQPPDDSPLRGANLEETRTRIANAFDLPANQISGLDGGVFDIDVSRLKAGQLRALAGGPIADLLPQSGRIQRAMNQRVLTKFWNAPSLFNPINRTASNLQGRYDNWTRSAKRSWNKERVTRSGKKAGLKPRYEAAKTSIRNKIGNKGMTAASGVLNLTGALCVVKEVSELLPLANFANVVQPSMEAQIDIEAVASQIQGTADPDNPVNMQAVSAVHESLIDDDGKTVWPSAPMQALANNSDGAGYEDISLEYKQAYTFTGGSIEELMIAMTGRQDGGVVAAAEAADATADVACSTFGYIVQGVAGAALLALGPGGWITKAGQFASSAATMAGIMHVLNSYVTEEVAANIPDKISGPVGGALLPYAARYGHNMTSAVMGTVPLSDSEAQISMDYVEQREREDFQQQSFVARIFNPYDYHSLVGSLVRPLSSFASLNNLGDNLANLLQPSTFIGSLSGLFTPKAAAAGGYDWGFPLSGIPSAILQEGSEYEDPYENAEMVAGYFNDGKHIERAEACFGIKIVKSPGPNGNELWDAVSDDARGGANPNEQDYIGANCGDISNPEWLRVIAFVLDTRIIKIMECYNGDETICAEIGFGSGGVAGSVTGSGPVTLVGDKAFPLAVGSKSQVGGEIFQNGDTQTAGHPYTAYDIIADKGTTVVAMTSGKVVRVSNTTGCGKTAAITINMPDQGISIWYGHLEQSSVLVSEGQDVSAGTPLARLVDSAIDCDSGADHLHIDASVNVNGDTGRPGCARAGNAGGGGCPEENRVRFRSIGPELYNLYMALPD